MQNIEISYFFTMTIYWRTIRNICCYSICHFWCYNIHNRCNFVTRNCWIIDNTFKILAVFINTSARIPTLIFLTLMILFTLTLTCFIISFLIWITCFTIQFTFAITRNIFSHCFCFIFVCYYINALTFFVVVVVVLEHIFLEIRHYNFQYIYLN